MLRLFNDNKPYVLLLLPFIAGVPFVIYHLYAMDLFPSTIQYGLWGSVSVPGQHRIWYLVFGFLAQLGGGISLNYLFNQSNLYERNNYLPSLFFCVFMNLSPLGIVFNGTHIAIILIIISLHQLLRLAQNQSGLNIVFNASLIFGFSATLHTALYVITPFIFLLLLTFRPFVLREFSTFLVGLMLPLYFVFAYRYYFDFQNPWNENRVRLNFEWTSLSTTIMMCILFLVFVVFILSLFTKWSSFVSRTKKDIQFILSFLLLLFLSGIIHLIFPNFTFHLLLFLVPVSILFTFSFLGKRNTLLPSILFYVVFIFVITKFIYKY
jgi:hypothetical protein